MKSILCYEYFLQRQQTDVRIYIMTSKWHNVITSCLAFSSVSLVFLNS